MRARNREFEYSITLRVTRVTILTAHLQSPTSTPNHSANLFDADNDPLKLKAGNFQD
jgi:hypothetical protein